MKAKANQGKTARGMRLVVLALAFSGVAQAGNDYSRRVSDIISEQQEIRRGPG